MGMRREDVCNEPDSAGAPSFCVKGPDDTLDARAFASL